MEKPYITVTARFHPTHKWRGDSRSPVAKPSMTLAELYGFRMRFLKKVVEEVEREEDFPFIAPRGEIAVLEDERS